MVNQLYLFTSEIVDAKETPKDVKQRVEPKQPVVQPKTSE